MKKIIASIFGFALIFMGQTSLAAPSGVSWNTLSNDCSTIAIANDTQQIGFGSPCWTGRNISTNPGDYVKVRVYYHNTGNTTANNTHIKIIKTGSSTNYSFYGQIVSDAGTFSSSNPTSVSLTIPANQTLSFVRTEWYPNQSNSNQYPNGVTLLNGQSGSEILSPSGLDIGDIAAAGWTTQGTAMAIFKVSNITPPPQNECVLDSLSASPTTVVAGGSSTIFWNTTDCNNVKLNNSPVNTYGSQLFNNIQSATTYTLTGNSANGNQKSRAVVVSVNTPSVMTGEIHTTNSDTGCTIPSGASTCPISFTWTTQNPVAISAVTNNGVNVGIGNNNTKVFSVPNGNQTYYLYNNAQQLDSANVTASCASNSSWNGTYCNPNTVNTCVIDNFTANSNPISTTITSGASALLDWNTTNCDYTKISVGPIVNSATYSPDDSISVSPTQLTTYTLSAYSSGSTKTKSVRVYVNNSNPTNSCNIISFTASPSTISNGGSSVLSWVTSSDCVNVSLDGANVLNSSSKTVWPTQTTTYTLNAENANGIGVGAQATIYVNGNNNNCTINSFTASNTYIQRGNSSVLNWATTGCSNVTISNLNYNVPTSGSQPVYPNDTTTYTLNAQSSNGVGVSAQVTISVNIGGGGGGGSLICYIDNFTASDTWINSGEPVTLTWNTSYCDNVYISSIGNVYLDGSKIVYPRVPTTYTLTATRNGYYTQTRSVTVNMDEHSVYNSNVVTTVATNISQTGAQLNGLITNSNYVNNSVYFEYGTTVNLGTRTASRSTNGNTTFSEYVTNLSPKTIYFFQAVSSGPNGISRGAIEVFQTLGYATGGNNIVRQVVYRQGTTVLPSASPIMLQIGNKYQMIGVGDVVDYTVYYKNISSSVLTNPMVQVYIPKGITLLNSSRGTYSDSERTLSVPIENLNPNDEGYIYLQARVDSLDVNLAQIVTTAILIYTNPNGAQENAMAYVLNNPRTNNNSLLGASAFFGGMFGMSLIGWLILIIIIMLLILLSRSYYGRKSVTTTVTHQ